MNENGGTVIDNAGETYVDYASTRRSALALWPPVVTESKKL